MSARAMIFPAGAGALAALATVGTAMLSKVELAIAMPLGVLAGMLVLLRPMLGLCFLLFFSLADALMAAIFAPTGLPAFKVVSAITALGALGMAGTSRRDALGAALAEPVVRLGLAFTLWMPVTIMLGVDRGFSASAAALLLTVSLLMYLIVILAQDMRGLRLVIDVLIASMVVSSLILMIEIATGVTLVSTSRAAITAETAQGFRRSSGASNADPTTTAIMALVGVTLALIRTLEISRNRLVYLIAAVIGTIGLVFSFSRSVMLIYGLTVLALGWRYRHSRYMAAGLIVALIFGACLLPFIPESYWDRLGSLFEGLGADRTLDRRWTFQIIGLDLLSEHPVFGIGPGNFNELFTHSDYRYLPGRIMYQQHLHNMYLAVAVEYGLVGFAILAAMIVAAFRSLISVLRAPANAEIHAIALMVTFAASAYFLESATNPNEENKYTWILLGLATAVGLVNRRLAGARREQARP